MCQLPPRRPDCPTRDNLASGIQSLAALSLSLLVPHNLKLHSTFLLQRCQCLQQALCLAPVLPTDTRLLRTAMGPTNTSSNSRGGSSGMATTSAKEASVLALRSMIQVPSLQRASRPPPRCRKRVTVEAMQEPERQGRDSRLPARNATGASRNAIR